MQIVLEKFEGPLALLFRLIEKEELDITQVSLARVADQFIDFIRTQEPDPNETADFLLVASKLLLIKSKALLPYLLTEADEIGAEALEEQLRQYRSFVEAAKAIAALYEGDRASFPRQWDKKAFMDKVRPFRPPHQFTVSEMAILAQEIFSRTSSVEVLEERMMEHTMSIDERINDIRSRLSERMRLAFSSLLSSGADKTEIIVSFLAMLELEKQRQVLVEQGEQFGEIYISRFLLDLDRQYAS